MSFRNTNSQNHPKHLSVATSCSSNIQNQTTRTIQMIPSLAVGNGAGTVSAPCNVSSSPYVGITGTPLFCFSNTNSVNSPSVQGYYVQLQSSGENIHEFTTGVPPMTSNNAPSNKSQSQQQTVSEQHHQAPVRSPVTATSALSTHIGGPTTPCHTICPQKQSGRQEADRFISQFAIMQACTPQPQQHVPSGSQTFAQVPFRLQGLHQANNLQRPQLDAQQLVRFQLYNVEQLLQSHSPQFQAQSETPITVSRQVPENRGLTAEQLSAVAVSQRNANPMCQQESFQSDVNHFPAYTENDQNVRNQLILYPNSLSSMSDQTLKSSSTQFVELSSATSKPGIQQYSVSGNGTQGIMQVQPQTIGLISNIQRGDSPQTINTTRMRSGVQSNNSLQGNSSQTNLRGINGPMIFRPQVGTRRRVQRIISIQRTDQGIRLGTLNSLIQSPSDIRHQTLSAQRQPQSVILRPALYANEQMKIHPQPPSFQQTSFAHTQDANFRKISSNVTHMAPVSNDQLLKLAQTTRTQTNVQPVTTSREKFQQKFTNCHQTDFQSTPSKPVPIDSNTPILKLKENFEGPEMFLVKPQQSHIKNCQPFLQQSSLQPTPCTQLGIESYQTTFQQPIYHSVPAQAYNPQDFQQLINLQFDHQQTISSSSSPKKGSQFVAYDNAELAGTFSHLSDPVMLDIRSPSLEYCKSEAEINTIAPHSVQPATFYKPFIFRKTLPAGATNEISDAVQNKSKSARRRKQPLKKAQQENGSSPDKQSSLPTTTISQSPSTPSTTVTAGKKNATTKKTQKSKGPALVTKSLLAAEMGKQRESLLNQASVITSTSLAPKIHKRPTKLLSNDITIVRESNQLSIMKNITSGVGDDSVTCPAPKTKRRKKATDNEVHKGIKSGSAGPKVLDAAIVNETSEGDFNPYNGEKHKDSLQDVVGTKVAVHKHVEESIRDKLLDTVEVNAGAEWKTSFDQCVKCVIKGVSGNREAPRKGLNAMHKFTIVDPSVVYLAAVRKDVQATLKLCVAPKVKLTMNAEFSKRGVFTFDVVVLGLGFVDYPKVKVQITPDYPADIPVFLDLESTKDSIENPENKRKFTHAVSLLRAKLRTIPDRCYTLPNVIRIWSRALRLVTNHNLPLQIEDRDERIMQALLM